MDRFSQTTAPSTTHSNVVSNVPLSTAAGVQQSHPNQWGLGQQWGQWAQWNQHTVHQVPEPVQPSMPLPSGAPSLLPQIPVLLIPAAIVVPQPVYGPVESWFRDGYSQYYIQTASARSGTNVANGTYGNIFRVQYGNTHLAVKRSKTDLPRYYTDTLKEARILATLNHPNVVNLQGYVANGRQVSMVMPFYIDDLWNCLGAYRLSPALKSQMCKNITRGVEYIHNESYIHGDLKSANILIDSNNNPVITDFGLACPIQQPDFLYSPCTYLAPELSVSNSILQNNGTITEFMINRKTIESDVFCLGGLILSIISNTQIYNYWRFHPTGSQTVELTALNNFRHCHRLPIMDKVIIPCMSIDSNRRPSVPEILQELKFNRLHYLASPIPSNYSGLTA